jgi:hypothetical protein
VWTALFGVTAAGLAQQPAPSKPAPVPETRLHVPVRRAAGPITIDGDLSDPGWVGAAEITTFYEVEPGDNTPPQVPTKAFVTYDDRFFYVAFRCDDPEPSKIRAHYVERDRVRSDQDFVGIMLDTRGTGRTATEFWVNPYGNVDDAALDEGNTNGSGEDFSPDFFWETAAKITSTGWQAEMRIPFSTLRYSSDDPQTWGITVLRNYPRDFRRQMASNRSPRDSNCFICHALRIEGLSGLPRGAHWVVAPYATFTETGEPREGPGTSFVNRPVRSDAGGDVKFIPSENTAFDGTINPDFSQIESDVTQISANVRFALFYPEKRPFFMEQSQLFNMPIQAAYTRTITSPRWGVRSSGGFGSNVYTVLVGEDRGGGSVILPGPAGSSSAPQDFQSFFGIGRIQHSFAGRSFVSFFVSDREVEGRGGGYNRVFGPDFQWAPDDANQVFGQALVSETETPDREDLAPEWTGRSFSSRAMLLGWNHGGRHWSWNVTYRDYGDGFRANNGFVPQVGIREGVGQVQYTFYPKTLLSRVVPFLSFDYVADASGRPVTKVGQPGFWLQGPWGLYAEVDYNAYERELAGSRLLPAQKVKYTVQLSPPGFLSSVGVSGEVGREIDYIDARSGHGGSLTLTATARPSKHFQLDANLAGQWLYLDGARLFRAQVERLKATYVLNRTTFARVIGQYVRTDYDPARYSTPLPRTTGGFDGSALLGYQLNWQSVLYLGYGDSRSLDEQASLQRTRREVFLKISYAFQR